MYANGFLEFWPKNTKTNESCTILDQFNRDGDKRLNHIVTADKIYSAYNTPKMKRQSMVWHHSRSPSKPKRAKQIYHISIGLMTEADSSAIQNKLRRLLSRGVGRTITHDHIELHRWWTWQFKWEPFDHRLFCLDLAQSYFHLMPRLKDSLGGSR